MKTRLITTLLALGLLRFGIGHAQDWERVDRHSCSVRSDDPATLARLLTQNLNTDREKVKYWLIGERIAKALHVCINRYASMRALPQTLLRAMRR